MGGKSNALGNFGSELSRVLQGKINIDPYAKETERGKREDRKDAKQKAEAIARQKEEAFNLRKSEAQEADKAKTSILLGRKGKRKDSKKYNTSPSMGLQKGDTGIQQ